ncbi:PorP/SprF family type IX secretion system membrane protein [Puia sp.]|uniref:PorP/SprF family type IX secretion system membrane protein n=1 Tax=Puia sp. TaxID=2045100 RepID=UPI002F41148D
MNRHRSYSFLFVLLLSVAARAQDIHFSQFYETPLLRNPSLAGLFTGDYRVQTVFRDQWNSFTDAYRTGSLNAEVKWPVGQTSDYFTTALQVLYDKAGTAALTTTELLPALNYHKSLSDEKPMFLSLGFMGGLVEKTLDLSKVTTNSQFNGTAYDPALPNGETILTPNVHYLDGSIGISFNTSFGPDNANTMYAGFAYHHLNRPKNSFYKNPAIELDPKIVFSGGLKVGVNDYSYFTLYADYSRQGPSIETIGGVLYTYKLGPDPDNYPYSFTIGTMARWNDALIPIVKLEMNSFNLGLSYDINVSRLNTVSNSRGGFELSLSYTGLLNRDHERTTNGKFHDPRF